MADRGRCPLGSVLFTAGAPRRGPARRWLAPALMALAASGVVIGGWLAWDLGEFDRRHEGRVLPGVRVAGLELTGLGHDEALAQVQTLAAPERERTITLRLEDAHWTTTPEELGYRSNGAEQVEAALAAAAGLSTWDRLMLRWGRRTLDLDFPVTSEVPRSPRRRLIERIAAEANRAPEDATLTWDRDRPTVIPGRVGRAVDVSATLGRLNAALDDPATRLVTIATEEVAPEVTSEAFDQILFLRQHRHQLDLWLGGRLVRSYTVAVGTGNYPTPTGRYEVTLKRYQPTWVNPSPGGWGRGMPARIGPGPTNPLGLRALNWSALGAIRFHGTADVDSLGRDASHGCVRLSNPDVIELYDLVDEGAVIISTT